MKKSVWKNWQIPGIQNTVNEYCICTHFRIVLCICVQPNRRRRRPTHSILNSHIGFSRWSERYTDSCSACAKMERILRCSDILAATTHISTRTTRTTDKVTTSRPCLRVVPTYDVTWEEVSHIATMTLWCYQKPPLTWQSSMMVFLHFDVPKNAPQLFFGQQWKNRFQTI